MNLHQLEAQWRQLKATIKPRLQIPARSASYDTHPPPDTPTDDEKKSWRLSLTDIKERLEDWDKHTQ